jgi:hypothetical protein
LFSNSEFKVIGTKNGLRGLEKVNQIQSELIICELITQKKMGVTLENFSKKYTNIRLLFLTSKKELED